MKWSKKNGIKRTWISLILFAGLILLQTKLPVQAETAQTVANLVLFVKYPTDTGDVFNAQYSSGSLCYNNWKEIKKMYQEGNGYVGNNSFQNYIATITEGKVNVVNVFPQEYDDAAKEGGKAVATYCLTRVDYANDGELIQEVITYCNNANLLGSFSVKLDNVNAGIIDNLTIIVQGSFLPGNGVSHKAQYGGTDTIGGLLVSNYNMMSSSVLVTDDASLGAKQAQGVIAHEFLHTLGFSDLYRYSGIGVPVGDWDVMASNSSFLQYPLSYQRAQKGWVDIPEITTAGTYTLTAVSETGGTKAFLIKTPLSDSEYIVMEYRRQADLYTGQFEIRIPGTGLLMYRVDTKVANATNAEGQNYIYVYRPGVSDPENASDVDAGGVNLVYQAALGEGGSYGSTDLNADFSENTLYYSDGSNSGVRISDVSISADGKQLTFRIQFADYTGEAVWDKLGNTVDDSVYGDPVLYADPDSGSVYAAYSTSTQLEVKKWNGSAWVQTGQALSGAAYPALAACAGELYLAYWDSAGGRVVCSKLENGSWNTAGAYSASNPMSIRLIVDGSNLLAGYQEDADNGQKKLVIRDIKKNELITEDKRARDFGNPSIVKLGSGIYVLYSDFFSSSPTKMEMYDTSKKTWTTVREYGLSGTNCHIIEVSNGKLYSFVGGTNMTPVVSVYDGAQWVDTSVTQMSNYPSVTMEIIGDEVYITYMDSNSAKTPMLRKNGSGFETLYSNLGTNLVSMDTGSVGATMFLMTKAINTTEVVVRSKTLSLPGYPLSLTPPAGYDDSHIYIDGVEYGAVRSGDSYSVNLTHTNGRTAIMYRYNEKGIPVGMYVWKISYQNGCYSATALPGLQDLLSYHGFSIRVTSPSGIRFKSGIDTTMKANLLSGGVEGYRLSEYGTLFMTNANRAEYPFVKLGRKTGGGRSYWTENGVTNDKVFETVSGRNRFASVLTKLPTSQYATEFAFRGYIILDNGSERILLYGSPVSRSIYTVAKQIMAKGEFKEGSNGYNYVQGIIKSVEE